MDYNKKICYKQYENEKYTRLIDKNAKLCYTQISKERKDDYMFCAKNFVSPQSLEEAWQLNQKKVNKIAGGMLWLKMSKQNFDTIIDLSLLGLDKIEENENAFEIGAYVTLRDLEKNEALNNYCNCAVRDAVKSIVGVQFRNCATVGGSIFGRYGFSDVLSVFLSMNTVVELYKGGEMPLEDFIKSDCKNDILVKIKVLKDGGRYYYQSVRNTKTDFPVLTCAAAAKSNKIRLVFGARPFAAKAFEYDFETDKQSPEEIGNEIALKVKNDVEVYSNMRGSAEYRAHLAGVLAKRACLKLGGAE